MAESVEISSEIVSIRHHLVEGQLELVDGQYVLTGVHIPNTTAAVDVPVDDILSQYAGEEIRIVVIALADADRLLGLAQKVSDG